MKFLSQPARAVGKLSRGNWTSFFLTGSKRGAAYKAALLHSCAALFRTHQKRSSVAFQTRPSSVAMYGKGKPEEHYLRFWRGWKAGGRAQQRSVAGHVDEPGAGRARTGTAGASHAPADRVRTRPRLLLTSAFGGRGEQPSQARPFSARLALATWVSMSTASWITQLGLSIEDTPARLFSRDVFFFFKTAGS